MGSSILPTRIYPRSTISFFAPNFQFSLTWAPLYDQFVLEGRLLGGVHLSALAHDKTQLHLLINKVSVAYSNLSLVAEMLKRSASPDLALIFEVIVETVVACEEAVIILARLEDDHK